MYISILDELLCNGFNVIGVEKDSKGKIHKKFTEDDIDVYQHYNNPSFIAVDSCVFLYFFIYINIDIKSIDKNIIEEIIQVMKTAENIRHQKYDAELVGYFNKDLNIKVNIMKLPFGKIYF